LGQWEAAPVHEQILCRVLAILGLLHVRRGRSSGQRRRRRSHRHRVGAAAVARRLHPGVALSPRFHEELLAPGHGRRRGHGCSGLPRRHGRFFCFLLSQLSTMCLCVFCCVVSLVLSVFTLAPWRGWLRQNILKWLPCCSALLFAAVCCALLCADVRCALLCAAVLGKTSAPCKIRDPGLHNT